MPFQSMPLDDVLTHADDQLTHAEEQQHQH
jgi:hypothetical protein